MEQSNSWLMLLVYPKLFVHLQHETSNIANNVYKKR